MRLGRMSYTQLSIAMSNMALWATAIALSQSNRLRKFLVSAHDPLNQTAGASSTLTDTPIVSNSGERTYSSVVILDSEKLWE